MKICIKSIKKLRPLVTIAAFLLLALVMPLSTFSAPVVVIPGDGAGYVYYSAGGGGAPATPTEDDSNVGMVAAFFFTPPADTWVVCEGQTISATTYPKLVKALTGSDAAASAVMPNLRGYFLRGANTSGAGVDPGRAVGSAQADGFGSHSHAGTTGINSYAVGATTVGGEHHHEVIGYAGVAGTNFNAHIDAATNGWSWNLTGIGGSHQHWFELPSHTHAFTTSLAGIAETRPHNIAVIYAMRAK